MLSQHHINTLDGDGNLGLNEDSILHYFIADQRREIGKLMGEEEEEEEEEEEGEERYGGKESKKCYHDSFLLIGNALLPPLTPYQSLATGTTVRIVLRGMAT